MRYDYDPFDKPFDDIVVDDLAVLFSVAEGWYAEYKQDVPNAGAIAKSITAFANTYGGWLFYGVVEKSKDDAVAGAFPGVACAEADAALQRIRQAVANHAQPSPYFRAKALVGPVDSIGLPEGRCVIVAQIPWGSEAPYIHKDGRIYRRVGDGSEPKPENDRFVLDQLWRRSAKITRQYADWIDRELETSKAEENAPYVRIFLIADFWRDHGGRKSVPLTKVREIMSSVSGYYTIPFHSIYQTSDGFVCRQTENENPERLSLTWKLGGDFNSEIILPIAKFRGDLQELDLWFRGYEHFERFSQACAVQRYLRPAIIDLNLLLHVLLGVARIQVALAKEFGWSDSVFAKIKISGIWRIIPYFDSSRVVDEFEKHGLPLSLRDEIVLHNGSDIGSFVELGSSGDEDDEACRIGIALHLFVVIAIALGVPIDIDPDGDGSDVGRSIGDFLKAGERALEVQKKRVDRK